PIRIDDNNEPEPDVALVKYQPDYYSTAHPIPAEVLAVIEVSGSSIRFDKDIKSLLYASCGISEYWIIDMNEDQLEVFSDPKGGNYAQKRLYDPTDNVTLRGNKLAVKDLLLLT
ncbi:MAG TPA: Uma2 family endonuclease, partial [Cyclobacteriaceae bacterium]|nr:Uma2 family endonuclease [Cyclobacteriaceae bacterium]